MNLFEIEFATGRHWYSYPAMTIETTTSIQLKDITAVEFECRKCGAKTIRKLNADFQPPGICGNCSELWFTDGSERHHELREFFARFIFQLEREHPFNLKWHLASVTRDVQTGGPKTV